MENTELDIQGLILDDNTIIESDFIILADDKIVIPHNENTKSIFYNQSTLRGERPYWDTRWSCGLFWIMWVISDLTWYEFTKEDILSIQRLAVDKYKLKVPWGMYMYRAVDCLRNWWNAKFPDKKLISFRTHIWSDIFLEALQKKHSLVVWYKTSIEYYKDSQDDWKISKEDYPKWWGHLVRTNFLNRSVKIDDNYFGTKKFNTYENDKIIKLKENWVFFPSAYLFLFDTSIKDDIRDNIDLEKAKEAMDNLFWNWLNPRKSASRQEVATMMQRIYEKLIDSK